jgi:hypothetical protein
MASGLPYELASAPSGWDDRVSTAHALREEDQRAGAGRGVAPPGICPVPPAEELGHGGLGRETECLRLENVAPRDQLASASMVAQARIPGRSAASGRQPLVFTPSLPINGTAYPLWGIPATAGCAQPCRSNTRTQPR